MVWDKDLNALFVKAVNELGEGAGPKLIHNFMKKNRDMPTETREQVGRLTKEQVGSHLQKHKEKKKELHQPHHYNQQPVVCQQQIQNDRTS
ncbi:hypothetical protein K1719_028153 [Acacia pycnantha]|nr:hypothetical protein K1719_028153 [Acacia pycnantha]